ncbi:MAG: AraC family transcriptional regulator [Cellulosilyticaceae bacterium]
MFELSLPLTSPHTDRLNLHVLYSFYSVREASPLDTFTPQYHAHDFLELSIILDGSVGYTIDDASCHVKKGDVLIFNPGVYHQEAFAVTNPCVQLHIGIENVILGKSLYSLLYKENDVPVLSLDHCKDAFFACCEEILLEQKNQYFGYHIALKALVMKLLILLCRELETTPHHFKLPTYSVPNTEKHLVVESIINYIHDHYTDDISLELISKNMFLSSVYISKIFKELTGDSPIHYLIKIRLEKAYDMLLTQNLSINEVAQQVGYKDAYYFSKLFKKHYGIPPSYVSLQKTNL